MIVCPQLQMAESILGKAASCSGCQFILQ